MSIYILILLSSHVIYLSIIYLCRHGYTLRYIHLRAHLGCATLAILVNASANQYASTDDDELVENANDFISTLRKVVAISFYSYHMFCFFCHLCYAVVALYLFLGTPTTCKLLERE